MGHPQNWFVNKMLLGSQCLGLYPTLECSHIKTRARDGQIAQQVKELATKPNDLDYILRTHRVERIDS